LLKTEVFAVHPTALSIPTTTHPQAIPFAVNAFL
jgi:hypothetical protein